MDITNEKLYLSIIENLSDGVYFVDAQRHIKFWNHAAERITGYTGGDVIGKSCDNELLNHIDKEGLPLCDIACPLSLAIADGQPRSIDAFLKTRENYRIPIRANIFPIKDNGEIIGAVEIFTPSSAVVYDDGLIERLSDLAMNDQLTGIANRRKMEGYLQLRLTEIARFKNKCCVLFLDIDDFSTFNNTYGHDVGDDVLKRISQAAQKSVRSCDLFGRWGGEEFVGVFAIRNDYDVVLIGEKIRALIAAVEIPVGDKKITVTASIGVTAAKRDDTVESVVKRADDLMYHSKRNGKNRVSSDMNMFVTRRNA